ncbi:hypothetical protein PPERSA_03477 [Pseudocohnilembus persalinus]|uniref:MORN motif n=1 Tax=Pseudocohnilembus persalinus TaxID=266149 RepID=A0A0V0QBQ1_PSEPJ|nr:hypothetical protein PPERSA_03477 [Pseudocohnilembus persalinus]|eukprot:KRW99676.1 hypothetical protein PPERSA_03477 [Pseudocohnilembus persalinus]
MNKETQIIQIKVKNYQNGIYQGQFNTQQEKIQGEGIFFWNTGDFYAGQWENNKMQGLGIYISRQNIIYKGSFQNGTLQGLGELIMPTGRVQKGFWKQGKLQNLNSNQEELNISQYFEKFKIKENPYLIDSILQLNLKFYSFQQDYIVIGDSKIRNQNQQNSQQDNLENQKISGIGAIINNSDFKISIGLFQNGELNGRGRIIFESGDIYDGFLQNNQFNGPGVYYNSKDKIHFYGAFQDNQIKEIFMKTQAQQFLTILQVRQDQNLILDYDKVFNNKLFSQKQYGDSENQSQKLQQQKQIFPLRIDISLKQEIDKDNSLYNNTQRKIYAQKPLFQDFQQITSILHRNKQFNYIMQKFDGTKFCDIQFNNIEYQVQKNHQDHQQQTNNNNNNNLNIDQKYPSELQNNIITIKGSQQYQEKRRISKELQIKLIFQSKNRNKQPIKQIK